MLQNVLSYYVPGLVILAASSGPLLGHLFKRWREQKQVKLWNDYIKLKNLDPFKRDIFLASLSKRYRKKLEKYFNDRLD